MSEVKVAVVGATGAVDVVATRVGERDGEVGDLAKAVAAQRERVGVVAQSVLAGVEGVLAVGALRRVAIGDD